MPAERDLTNWVQVEGDHADDTAYLRSPLAPTEQPTDEARTTAEAEPEINATDGAVEYAKEVGVDLSDVKGSGVGGRITKGDVEAAGD